MYTTVSTTQTALVNLFVYCFFGDLATKCYGNMANTLYEVNWQDLPIKFQKYFFVMIMNMQIPLYYDGFGVAILELRTFTSVRDEIFRNHLTFSSVFQWSTISSLGNRKKVNFPPEEFLTTIFLFFPQFQILKTVFTYFMSFKTLTYG